MSTSSVRKLDVIPGGAASMYGSCASSPDGKILFFTGGITMAVGANPSTTVSPATQLQAYASKVNVDGTLVGLKAITSTPTHHHSHQSHVMGSFLYLVGGYSSSGSTISTVVDYGKFDQNGQIQTWKTVALPPSASVTGSSFVYGQYLYICQGSKIFRARQNASDGSLDAWQVAGFLYGAGTYPYSAVVVGDRLYAIGGDNKLHSTSLNNGNDIGAGGWRSESSVFSGGVLGTIMIVHGDYLYFIGGFDSSKSAALPDIQAAHIVSSGLEKASSIGHLGGDVLGAAVGLCGNHLYVIGGGTTAGTVGVADILQTKLLNGTSQPIGH